MTALRKLIEAVESGTWDSRLVGSRALYRGGSISSCNANERLASAAYHGSIDAAKALHEALLPGWKKNMAFTEFSDGSGAVTMFGPMPCDAGKWDFAPKFEARGGTQARAWLLAILRAYEAQK